MVSARRGLQGRHGTEGRARDRIVGADQRPGERLDGGAVAGHARGGRGVGLDVVPSVGIKHVKDDANDRTTTLLEGLGHDLVEAAPVIDRGPYARGVSYDLTIAAAQRQVYQYKREQAK